MKRLNWRSAKDIFFIVVALAIAPLALWVMRPHPLSASSSLELREFIRNSRQEEILKPMAQRYEAMSLNFKSVSAGPDPQIRWLEIQTNLQNSGADDDQAWEVIRAARPVLKETWPCFVERGYLQDQPVWVVVGSSPIDTGFTAWICPPSSQDIRQEQARKYCSNIQVAVISARPPHSALN